MKKKGKGKSREQGQASTEYLMITGFVLMLIMLAIYLIYNYAQHSSENIDKAQLDRLGREIVSTAEKVYYMGSPSRMLLEARMPKNVRNVSVIQNWPVGLNVLIFNISIAESGTVQTFAYSSAVNINGTFTAAMGERSISPGIKEINVEAYESGELTFAFINFGGRCPLSVTFDFNTDGVADASDASFFSDCYCNIPGYPKFRPQKTWRQGWFDNSGDFGGNAYAVCMNADYNADCMIDDEDRAQFCAATGLSCDPIICP